jgi:bifunctional non-homologous end joining protein LigD
MTVLSDLNHLKVDLPFWPETEEELLDFIDRARANNEEGIIARMGWAPYTPGRPNTLGTLLKYKFTESATVEVRGFTENKRSVEIGVLNAWGKIMPMGKVTIPPNYKMPSMYDLVEIEYLYVHPGEGGCFSMPQYKGPRPDKTDADEWCSLKFKKS